MILVVDDDIVIRTSLSLVLKRAGYSVEAVASPAEAICIIRSWIATEFKGGRYLERVQMIEEIEKENMK